MYRKFIYLNLYSILVLLRYFSIVMPAFVQMKNQFNAILNQFDYTKSQLCFIPLTQCKHPGHSEPEEQDED